MDSPIRSLLAPISLSCTLVLLYKLLRFGHRDKRLPPGPPTIPILGNAHQIPTHGVYKRFREWGDRYGKIYSLKIGAGTIVVLNDAKTIHDLIIKRSAIYSDRAIDQNSLDALGNQNFAFMHATPLWRAQRKIASQYLAPKSIDDRIVPIMDAEIGQLLHDLLTMPGAFRAHIKRVTASIAAAVIFGQRAPTVDSFWTTCVYDVMDHFNRVLEPGSYLPIEQFPILKLIPDSWAPSKARAKQAYKCATTIWCDARERVEERRRIGDLRDSICDRLLSGDLKCDIPLDPVQTAHFLGVLDQGAADTTSSMMMTNILWLAAHPWVQEKAWAELDRVCGSERMPTWADFKDLPYINCILKESLRVRPVLPEGLPHRLNRDDWYDDYLLPKDSTVFIPAHILNRACEDPESYNPDRYLNRPKLAMDYAGSPDYMNRDHYTYGAGRRICVGIHLAERTQWRIIARILWAFKLEPGLDETTGKPLKLDLNAYVDGFVVHPAPYKVRFTPRSEKHAEVIQRDFKQAEDFLKRWE